MGNGYKAWILGLKFHRLSRDVQHLARGCTMLGGDPQSDSPVNFSSYYSYEATVREVNTLHGKLEEGLREAAEMRPGRDQHRLLVRSSTLDVGVMQRSNFFFLLRIAAFANPPVFPFSRCLAKGVHLSGKRDASNHDRKTLARY